MLERLAPALNRVAPPRGSNSLADAYRNLLNTIGYLGLALPVLILVYAFLVEAGDLRGSISAYYHSHIGDVFVGVLILLGVGMILYPGHEKSGVYQKSPLWIHRANENMLTSVIGVGAIITALFAVPFETVEPVLAANAKPVGGFDVKSKYPHYIGASLYFVGSALYCIFIFTKGNGTQFVIGDPHAKTGKAQTWYKSKANKFFRTMGFCILGCAVVMAAATVLGPLLIGAISNDLSDGMFFWAEVVAVVAFAGAWLEQGRARFSPFKWVSGRDDPLPDSLTTVQRQVP